ILFSIIRTKIVAILLGPSGVGLFALFNSVADLAAALANLGVQSSGVRQIAEASGSDDRAKVAVTVTVVRRISFALAVAGALLLAATAGPVALVTFGT